MFLTSILKQKRPPHPKIKIYFNAFIIVDSKNGSSFVILEVTSRGSIARMLH